MSDDLVRNLKQPSAWLRVLFMAGFVIALYVAGVILLVLMLAQIVFSLLTGEDNSNLRRLGAGLATYVSQILAFLTYNTEQKPFPFLPFPADAPATVTPSPATPAPAAADPGVTEPRVVEPVVSGPAATQSAASGSSEEAQAVADDDGFQNPSAQSDDVTTPADATPSAAPKRSSGRKKKTIDPEAPQTDD